MENLGFFKKVGKGAGILFVGIILSKLFTYAFRAIVARHFGAANYGLLILAIAIVSFVALVIVLGLPQGLLRYIAYYLGKNDRQVIAPMIGSVIKVIFPASLFFGLVMFLFASEISTFIFHKPELVLFLRISSVLAPFLVLYNIFDNVLQAFQDAKALVISRNFADPLLKLVVLGLLVLFGFGVWGAAFAYVFGIVFSVVVMIYYIRRQVSIRAIFFRPGKLSSELVSYSLPLMFTNFSLMIFSWADVIILGVFLSSTFVGIYDAASVTSRLLSVVPLAFSTIFMPAITEVYAKNKSFVIALYNHVAKWVLLLLLPMLFFLAMFSDTMLESFFGSEFGAGAVSLVILLVGQLFWGWGLLASNMLAMMERTKLIFFNSALAAVMNIVLNFLLIPRIGILGAAIATALSLFTMAALNLIAVAYIMKAKPLDFYVVKLLFSITVPVIVLVIFFRSFIINLPLVYALGIGFLFSLCYGVLLFVTKSFDSEDVELFKLALRKYGMIK